MMAWRWRQTLLSSSTPLVVAEQRLAMAHPFERLIVADVRHHQLVTDVARPLPEEEFQFQLVDALVEVPVHRQLGRCGGESRKIGQVGHDGRATSVVNPAS
jgi:hypothetical protein